MTRFNENCVVIRDCTVVWDGMNRPEPGYDGALRYTLKLVIPPNSPDLAEFHQLANEVLQKSKFNGILPAGGRLPIGLAGPQEFGGLFPGYGVISAKTKFVPEVRAEDVSLLDPMQWAPMIYVGQRVNVLVDCYEYDAKGNVGIGTGLQGVQIVTSAGAQRLAIGGGQDTAGAFGGQPVQPAHVAGQPGPYAPPGAQPMPPPAQAGQPYQIPGQPPVVNPPGAQPHGGYAPPPAQAAPPAYIPPGPPVQATPPAYVPPGPPAQAAPPQTTGYTQPAAAPVTGAPQQQGFIPGQQ